MTTNFSKNISQYQITRRWIWSRLCGFPQFSNPGDVRINDLRLLYKSGYFYYGLKSYTIHRAAESLGVYPQSKTPYIREPAFMKPYMPGWRPNERSWSLVRNPFWRDNRDNVTYERGFCNWKQSAPFSYNRIDREDFGEKLKKAAYEYLREHPNQAEFHFPRPELFAQGFTKDSSDYIIRSTLIDELVPQMKIDDGDSDGEDSFETYDFEMLYGSVLDALKFNQMESCSRKHFYNVCYSFQITADDRQSSRGQYRRTHGLRPFLDVVDQIKLLILERLWSKTIRYPFDMFSLWEDFGIESVKERMLYDAATAELVYEGFLRVNLQFKTSRNDHIKTFSFEEEKTGRRIDARLLYLHTLNSDRRKFQQQRPWYYGQYIGYSIWVD